MAFAFVQSIDAYNGNNLTLNGVGAGNLLVAFITATATLASITVSGGGTWAALTQSVNSFSYVRLYYCLSATGGNSTFSLSESASDIGWGVLEFSKSGSAIYDSLTNTTVSYGTTFSSGNISVGNNNSLGVSCLADEQITPSTLSWDTGWVKQEENLSHVHSCAYRIIASAGTYTASGTRDNSSNLMVMSTVMFYESGGASIAIPVFMNQYRQRRN